MTNPTSKLGDQPAFPYYTPIERNLSGIAVGGGETWYGLSLRAYIATAALQGMLANKDVLQAIAAEGKPELKLDVGFAQAALLMADALLAELAKEKP